MTLISPRTAQVPRGPAGLLVLSVVLIGLASVLGNGGRGDASIDPATLLCAGAALLAMAAGVWALLLAYRLSGDLSEMATTRNEAVKAIRNAAEENAHALKTPIATINQALEPLWRQTHAGDDRLLRPVELIDQATNKLSYLVAQARALEESTADLLAGRFESVDVTFLLVGIGLDFRDVLAEDEIKLDVQVDKGLTVRGRQEGLRTAIENVLENAAGFSSAGGVIRLRGQRQGREVMIAVEDHGPGCHPDTLPRLFARYFSDRAGAPADHAGQADHAGIGLWIVKRNIEAMRGRVDASNRPEGGLRVTIRLPA